MNWNGKGLHPILKMTREEILAASQAVSEKHAGTRVDSEDKTPQPTLEEAVQMHLDNLNPRLEMFKERLERQMKEDQDEF